MIKNYIKKASVIACFFLFWIFSAQAETDNLWRFDSELQKAHVLILNLRTDQAYTILQHSTVPANDLKKLYLLSLCETVDVLVSEDATKFSTVEKNFKSRLEYIEEQPKTAETLFLQAELNLQLGFNYLNLGMEFNAVLAIRRANNFVIDCQKLFPQFIPIQKTSGVIQVMVGSIPDKYKWFFGLLGMKGSVIVGQQQLESLRNSQSSLNIEATALFYTIKGFINQQFDEAAKGILEKLKTEPDNRMLMFLAVNMLMKNSQSEVALKIIQEMDHQTAGLPVYYIEYLRGEILLQRGDYSLAIKSYEKFIAGYKSQSFKKDSYFKIGLCYWLMDKSTLAAQNFDIARKTGRDVAEPDKYAAQQLESSEFPNQKILKVRFSTDGGYYTEAKQTLASITPADLKTEKDKVEYYYRKARLAHKTGDIAAAKLFYKQTINMAGDNNWYFAPSSALQLGYIFQAQKENAEAQKYFEKALSYKKHEYKNSIDTKAKSALETLK